MLTEIQQKFAESEKSTILRNVAKSANVDFGAVQKCANIADLENAAQ